jgi:hypothetical protein
LFPGRNLGLNLEPAFFQRYNEWLLRRAGGAWDYPLPLKLLLADDTMRRIALKRFSAARKSRQFRLFCGWRGEAALNGVWGWKDPRTIFTFGLWYEIFPGARILYLTRNGVDVACSLRARVVQEVGEGKKTVLSRMPLSWRLRTALLPIERYVLQSIRSSTLEQGYALWEEYTAESQRVYAMFPGPKLALGYEELLADPLRQLTRAAEFCGLEPTERELERAVALVNTDRAFAFLGDSTARGFYDRVRERPLMRELGYGETRATPERS